MSPSDLDSRLLKFVGPTPQTATEIYRHFYGLPEGNLSMTGRMRRERRETAVRLEELAGCGWIQRTEGPRHGATIPLYFREASGGDGLPHDDRR